VKKNGLEDFHNIGMGYKRDLKLNGKGARFVQSVFKSLLLERGIAIFRKFDTRSIKTFMNHGQPTPDRGL
jgi:hypothetical protein